MKIFGIWKNTKNGKRIAILDTVENKNDFDPTHYFKYFSTPERVGEIEIEDKDGWVDEYFSVTFSVLN